MCTGPVPYAGHTKMLPTLLQTCAVLDATPADGFDLNLFAGLSGVRYVDQPILLEDVEPHRGSGYNPVHLLYRRSF